MKYVLLTHIPTFAGQTPAHIRWSSDWMNDLSAEVEALTSTGFEVTVATPMLPAPDSNALSRSTLVEIPLKKQAFTYAPLPGYRTMSQYLTHQLSLKKAIRKLLVDADVVQYGPGGHPISLGQIAWPIIRKSVAKKIFVFSDDPIPAWQKYAASGRNPAKRLAKKVAMQQLEKFCNKAVRESDLVFAHHPEVEKRFAKSWSKHCHSFHPMKLRDQQIGKSRTSSDKNKPLRIVSMGSAGFTRGVDHLFKALAKARRLNAKIELDLAGDVIGSAELMNILRDQSLESHVRLHGRLPEGKLIELFDDCDLLAACELIPAFDPIIFLGLARGMPILTYQSGSLDESIIGRDAGMVVPRGETLHLAQALLDLAANRSRVVTMSKQAIAWARESTLDTIHRTRAGLAMDCVRKK